MVADQSLWSYFFHAGLVVKLVMLMLLVASVVSWTFIFERAKLYKLAREAAAQFERRFWSGIELSTLYKELERRQDADGIEGLFQAGFKEFVRLRQLNVVAPELLLSGVQRAMQVAQWRELDKLERRLSFLATVGSTSPYIGLFGTVWGIMTALHALGNVQQATIAMVAPGISEALIATAMGLFAAIPAVIGYNRFNAMLGRLTNQYEVFQEELASILCHSTQQSQQPLGAL